MKTTREFWQEVNTFLKEEINFIDDHKKSFLLNFIGWGANILSIKFDGSAIYVYICDEYHTYTSSYTFHMADYLKWRLDQQIKDKK